MAKIGLIGLATMGKNLARNIARNFSISVYNRSTEKTEEFLEEFRSDNLTGEKTLEAFVESLEKPRKIILMVKAGDPVDAVIEQLKPLLEDGDIIIDGGNSHYQDTKRRQESLLKEEKTLIGMGISGGEEGALNGPSMMPGGDKKSYDSLEEILMASSAEDGAGGKCIAYIGEGPSGHFVKMVHNGIEYGIMQLIAEAYDILKKIGKLSNKELAETFANWNKENPSYLLEITAKIFAKKDEGTGQDLIDLIRDSAKQKGTGKWTTEAAFDYGVSTTTINAAVDARIKSGALKDRQMGKEFPIKTLESETPENLKEIVHDALHLSTMCTYFQGFGLLQTTSTENNWDLNLSEIARIWRGGCIIRSDFLEKLQIAYGPNAPKTGEVIDSFGGKDQENWRKVVQLAIANAIPVPTLTATLSSYDSLAAENLPQNLTQAQRDFFGAHGFERTDKEGSFHTEWE